MEILRFAQDDRWDAQDDRWDVQDDRWDAQDDRWDVQDDRWDDRESIQGPVLPDCSRDQEGAERRRQPHRHRRLQQDGHSAHFQDALHVL